MKDGTTRHELVELARICARNAEIATSKEVAHELSKMAREYRQKAAELVNAAARNKRSPVAA
jgi:hypothetical protein